MAGDNLCITGNHVYNLFKDGSEVAYYMCQDKINDVVLLHLNEEKAVPVLACNDRILQVLDVSGIAFALLRCTLDPQSTDEMIHTRKACFCMASK